MAPIEPLEGAKELTIGTPTTVKLVGLIAVPPLVVTEIGPVTAPLGTVTVTDIAEILVTEAAGTVSSLELAPAN